VFTALKIQVEPFWVVTPCSIKAGHHRFGESCCLHLHEVTAQQASTWIGLISHYSYLIPLWISHIQPILSQRLFQIYTFLVSLWIKIHVQVNRPPMYIYCFTVFTLCFWVSWLLHNWLRFSVWLYDWIINWLTSNLSNELAEIQDKESSW